MAEKRNVTRQKKRLSLKFGIDSPTRVAFTEDLTINGLFVRTASPLPPGTRVIIEVSLPNGEVAVLEGMARWRKTVPPQVIHLAVKTGMGIKIQKFISGEDSYKRFIAGRIEQMQTARAS